MREAAIQRFGGPDELRVIDGPVPQPAPGEVQLKVIAAGTNPVDYKIRDGSSGMVANFDPADFPLVLGRECSGVVTELGEGVTTLAVGDTVFGMPELTHPAGCYAEYVCLPADALVRVPEGADPIVLGGTALAGLTAWIAVHELGRVQAGDTVLVHGGSGGVGQLIVQLCRQVGAEVWATASTRNQQRLAELGAHPVDYTSQDFRTEVPPCDVIIDGVYFDTFTPSLDHLKPGGRIVALPTLSDLSEAKSRGIEASIPRARPIPEALTKIAEMVASGELSVEVSQVLPLERAAEAHRQLESGHTRGKIILDLSA